MTSERQDLNLSDITANLISEFDSKYLPSNFNVLNRLLYETQINKCQLSDAFKTVIKEVLKIWKNSTVTVEITFKKPGSGSPRSLDGESNIQLKFFRYLDSWYTASLAISATNNHLKLIKSLIHFQDIDKGISDATLHKLCNHLWYLTPELSILSLFDTEVDTTTKERIVEILKKPPLDRESDTLKKFDPSDEGIRALGDKSLDYFTNRQSLKLFEKLGLNANFLDLNCSEWEKDPSYIETREKLKHLVVFNECAERAVHLAEEFIHTRSQDEDQKQYLLQFISESRQNLLATSDKKELLKKLKTE